jgi:hypothetical protein
MLKDSISSSASATDRADTNHTPTNGGGQSDHNIDWEALIAKHLAQHQNEVMEEAL